MYQRIKTDRLTSFAFLGLFVLLVVTCIPWLGLTDFNTKGEPREAIVAVSMIESGDYILPVSMGADIPYKPPFLAWLIVGASKLTGGVNEFASRLPSAVAAIALAISLALFFYQRKGLIAGIATAIIFITSVEVWRAAMACRVDMVLTACIVNALLLMQSRYERKGVHGVSGWAVVMMTGAVLTKGPVGVLLPCLVMLVYYIARGEKFLRSVCWLALSGALALVIPAAWYFLAAERGGDTFVNLVMEENFGRFLGKMSYDSHVNPWWYNFLTLASGMLPYTLVAAMSLFVVKYSRSTRTPLYNLRQRLADMDKTELFALVVITVIFIFYCIPKSKRSVYLLPIYPFVSYYTWRLLYWLGCNHRRVLNIYSAIISFVAIIIVIAICSCLWLGNLLPERAIPIVESIKSGWWWMTIFPAATSVYLVCIIRKNLEAGRIILSLIVTIGTALWCVSGVVLPAILNQKSDRLVAETIKEMIPHGENVYTYIEDPMLRYYTIGFYTHDRLRLLEQPSFGASATLSRDCDSIPSQGWLITSPNCIPTLEKRHAEMIFTPVVDTKHRSCDTRDTIIIVKFAPRLSEFRF